LRLGRFVAARLAELAVVLVGTSVLAFLLVHLIPGNAIELYLGTQVRPTPAQLEELRRVFDLQGSLWDQYLRWAGRLLHGDFGYSLRTGQPVLATILQRLPLSAELALLALVLATATGVPAGVVSACLRESRLDRLLRTAGLLGLSIPDFWLGTLAVVALSRNPLTARWVAVGGWVPLTVHPAANLTRMLVPAATFAVGLASVLLRYTRTALLEVLAAQYLRTARAKGLSAAAALLRHGLRNALFPVITVLGFYCGYLLGGTVVIEQVFALPGMGQLVLQAVEQRDYPVVQGVALVVATAFVLVNLAVDVAYALLDPRIRYA
jgi:peptide/nickel transport system permease protein